MRAIVSKRVIDRLIREKLRQTAACEGVTALPVVWRRSFGAECNWEIPGWVGASRAMPRCATALESFLASLEAQFDIADEA